MSDSDTPLDLFSALPNFSGALDSFDSARLTQARFAAGYSKAKLAEIVGVTAAAVGQYESRTMSPRPDVMYALAKALDVPTEYFAIGRPIGRVDGSDAHFRSLRSTTARDRAKAIAFIEQVWELAFALEKRVQFPQVNLPELEVLDPDFAAAKLRVQWGVGAGPLRHLVALAESNGVIVSLLSLSNVDVARVGAFSTSHLPRPIVIATPERARSVFEHRFTIAHELGHILLHQEAAPGDPQQEREADQFAAALLTPREQIANLLPRSVDLARLEELSRRWGVSIESLLHRMRETGRVSDATLRRAYQRLAVLRATGAGAADPVSVYPGEVPSILMSAAALARDHGFSLAALANELRWKLPRVREVLGTEDPRPQLRLI